jgi:hypothetical protein
VGFLVAVGDSALAAAAAAADMVAVDMAAVADADSEVIQILREVPWSTWSPRA